MEEQHLASLAQTIKAWAAQRRQTPQQTFNGLAVLTAALALGNKLDREEFCKGMGTAYDETKKRAGAASSLIVGPNGSPAMRKNG